MLNWCDKQRIRLVVVGPEQPLADGIVELMQTDNRFVFGPSKAAAQLEAEALAKKKASAGKMKASSPYKMKGSMFQKRY